MSIDALSGPTTRCQVVRATGLFHATLPVWDLARAERFWSDMLGITRHATPSYFPTSVVFLDLGNTMIHLVRYGDEIPRPHPRSTHLAIEVDDLGVTRQSIIKVWIADRLEKRVA